MSHALAAPHFADCAWHGTVEVLENVRLAESTFRLRFLAADIARRIVPGQFLMLRLAGCDDPLLGRPLALYDTVLSPGGAPEGIDVVYLVQGKLTSRLARISPGQRLDVWGPLGNGFPLQPAEHLVMVAGGIGQTPFVAVAKEFLGLQSYGDPPRSVSNNTETNGAVPRAKRVTLCYGVRRRSLLAGVEDFERAGVRVLVSSDDGSIGHHGLVTDLLEQVLAEDGPRCRIVCCGPEPMMEAAQQIAEKRRVPCQLSLETPMACGIGICFSCVAKVRDEQGGWDYRRTCVEGPVFDASRILFA